MADFTDTNLVAAIIDQKVAGTFAGKDYAFTPVITDGGWELGVAVANERGYSPVRGKVFALEADAKAFANGLNDHLQLSRNDVVCIVISTMGGRPFPGRGKI